MKTTQLSPENFDQIAEMLKAIAHPVRISILSFLEDGKKMTVTKIHELLELEQSTTSHHLGILKNKGVLCSKREGKNTYYFIKNSNFNKMVDCMSKCACN